MVAADLTIVTPWYPTPEHPFGGAFVASQVAALTDAGYQVDVIHTQERDLLGAKPRFGPLRPRWRAWLERNGANWGPTSDPFGGGARLVRIPVPRRSGVPVAELARLHRDATATAVRCLGGWGRLVHAHVGALSGFAVAGLAPTRTPVVITEHYSRIQRILRRPVGRAVYAQSLLRADVFITVGESLRRDILGRMPWADHMEVLPNVVALPGVVPRETPPESLRRWICVGALIERKRPELVMKAFEVFGRAHPDATLTFVGSGELADGLVRKATDLAIGDRVEFLGGLPPEDAIRVIRDSDLLVHLSSRETFGVVVAEALGCGTPVIATRSGGPEEILDSELEPIAGMILDVDIDAEMVAHSASQLQDRLATLQPALAAAECSRRYSPASIAERLVDVYTRVGWKP
ncbi:MAG: glycosyltransferase [Candidatus Nanopelagicales bacterium]|nr:glycosyltransferase [Candidatus Nanopelagicales bacterium]MDZ4250180.1 glycosyltransferase [Candidatus Nanopelagicales bacterium]